ncbi:MAG: hypothetical protein ACFBRM_08725 [Pikeienuella sp.]
MAFNERTPNPQQGITFGTDLIPDGVISTLLRATGTEFNINFGVFESTGFERGLQVTGTVLGTGVSGFVSITVEDGATFENFLSGTGTSYQVDLDLSAFLLGTVLGGTIETDIDFDTFRTDEQGLEDTGALGYFQFDADLDLELDLFGITYELDLGFEQEFEPRPTLGEFNSETEFFAGLDIFTAQTMDELLDTDFELEFGIEDPDDEGYEDEFFLDLEFDIEIGDDVGRDGSIENDFRLSYLQSETRGLGDVIRIATDFETDDLTRADLELDLTPEINLELPFRTGDLLGEFF